MADYLVSRHSGTIAWVTERCGIDARIIEHWPPAELTISAEDVVYGTLPLHLAAEVCAKGARYVHLVIRLPANRRNDELDADDLDEMGAKLVEYRIEDVASIERKE